MVCGQVSAGEAEDTDGDDTVVGLDQNGAGDVGDVDEGVAGGVPGVGEDEDDVVDPEIGQFVDKHIDGFLAPRKWPINHLGFDRPGDGYWQDDHGIQSFSTSTADGLKMRSRDPRRSTSTKTLCP